MAVTFELGDGVRDVELDAVVVAGFTGRDQSAVLQHLHELAELGVPVPASTPTYYAAPPDHVVQTSRLATVRAGTSGEAECVLIAVGDETWITLGSDHTDRDAEALDIAVSKLLCPKPVATAAWNLDELADVEALELRSWVTIDGTEVLYQQGSVAEILPFSEIRSTVPFRRAPEAFALFTGTLPALGGIRPAARFRAALTDPLAGRTIELDYDVEVLDLFDDQG